MMEPIVLDPGHGGSEPNGNSTPDGVRGPNGTREKEVTLDIARRTRNELAQRGVAVLLTRVSDDNPSLFERSFVSREEEARAFISIHADSRPGDPRGAQAWIHERASGASRRLAEEVQRALSRVVGSATHAPLEGPLAVLVPAFQPPGCAACLVEVDNLADAGAEADLSSNEQLDAIAEALAEGILEGVISGDASEERGKLVVHSVQEKFDIWHEVPLVQQTSGMSCWAAAAAMLVGWRDCVDIDSDEVAHGTGHWEAYRDGLMPEGVQALSDAWGLILEPPRNYTVDSLRELLERNGPLWVGEASPGLHVVVITGMTGDGTPDGTHVRIADPWPVGRGSRYTITFSELQRNLEAAAGISGVPAQVLHTGGRGRVRNIFKERREMELSFGAAGR
jgi:N-acetylmuramoyl-L-alanine amidase